MRDFAASYQIKSRPTAPQQGWRTMNQTQKNNELFWKTLAIIVFLAAVIGVAASYWVGHCIQESLRGVAHAQELQLKKEQTKMALLEEQDRLLQDKRLKAYVAVQAGLYSPGKRQQIAFR